MDVHSPFLEPRPPPPPRPPKRFTVYKEGYGNLQSERDGATLYFSLAKIAPSVFILLRNNVIKDERSGKCWHLKTPTNQEIVLKSGCYGSRPLRWTIVKNKWLKVQKYRKCLSPWASPREPTLAGLNRCAAYNQMDIKFLPSKLQKYYLICYNYEIIDAVLKHGTLRLM